MIRFAKKLAAVVLAAVTACSLAISVSAAEASDIITLPTNAQCEGARLEGTATYDEINISGTVDGNNVITVHLMLKGDALESEFWNDPDCSLDYDVTLNTDISAYTQMPAFVQGYGWVNPVSYGTVKLKYGETITHSTPFTHFYNDAGGFGSNDPLSLLLQIGGNVSEKTEISVTISNIRITTAAATTTTVATTTTEATTTTTAPVETEPEVIETEAAPAVTEEAASTADAVTEEASATTAATTTTAKAEEETTAATTTAANTSSATTPATTTYSSSATGSAQLIKTLAIIVIVAAVLVVGAIVGYIIYKKNSRY